MKRVKPNCLKKRHRGDENDSVSIPTDLIIEILTRLPPKSISKLIIVSKLWLSIIRGKYFTELYLTRSSTRPRFLFTFKASGIRFFQSSSQKDPNTDHHKVFITDPYEICQPVRGLICGRTRNKVVVIANPSTGQFIDLPRVETKGRRVWTFFGYDPVNDLYKVLCMTTLKYPYNPRPIEAEEHQVFTLGAKQKEWRMIKCKHPHSLPTSGVCNNGVVYYVASIINHKRSLISFDLSSEEFNVIGLPEDTRVLSSCNLVNYKRKIALTADRSSKYFFDLWVLDDANKQEWYKVSFSGPWGIYSRFEGITSTGKRIFSVTPAYDRFHILYYEAGNSKKVYIEGLEDKCSSMEVFLDHVESPMFLSN